MKKMFLVLICLGGAFSAGYFLSGRVYSAFVKVYYERINQKAFASDMAEFRQIVREADYSDDKFIKLFRRLHGYSPENKELNAAGAVYYAEFAGNLSESFIHLEKALGRDKGDLVLLDKIIPFYFDAGCYQDISYILSLYESDLNGKLMYYAMVSLYKSGNYDRAIRIFTKAEKKNLCNAEMYFYAGIVGEKLSSGDKKKLSAAMLNFEKAFFMEKSKEEYADSLIRVYLKLGMKGKAAKIAGIK